jgi:hypothetical protein
MKCRVWCCVCAEAAHDKAQCREHGAEILGPVKESNFLTRVPDYRYGGLGSIPGATRFSKK